MAPCCCASAAASGAPYLARTAGLQECRCPHALPPRVCLAGAGSGATLLSGLPVRLKMVRQPLAALVPCPAWHCSHSLDQTPGLKALPGVKRRSCPCRHLPPHTAPMWLCRFALLYPAGRCVWAVSSGPPVARGWQAVAEGENTAHTAQRWQAQQHAPGGAVTQQAAGGRRWALAWRLPHMTPLCDHVHCRVHAPGASALCVCPGPERGGGGRVCAARTAGGGRVERHGGKRACLSGLLYAACCLHAATDGQGAACRLLVACATHLRAPTPAHTSHSALPGPCRLRG